MDFKKDLLIIDTEFSGFDLKKHDVLQLAAVLLDRKTLKEKKYFNSYIKPSRWKTRDPEAMAVNRIPYEAVKGAPSLQSVIKKFDKAFKAENIVQGYYVGYNDKRLLLECYRRSGVKWKFDYHYFELWGLFYPFLAKHGQLKNSRAFAGFGRDDLIRHFKIDSPPLHDALVDCRVQAEILRRVMKELR